MSDTCTDGCSPRCICRIITIFDHKPMPVDISIFMLGQSPGF